MSQARIPCSIAPVSESQHLSSKKLPLTKITKDLNLKDVISKSWFGLRVYAIWAAIAHPHSSMFTLRYAGMIRDKDMLQDSHWLVMVSFRTRTATGTNDDDLPPNGICKESFKRMKGGLIDAAYWAAGSSFKILGIVLVNKPAASRNQQPT